VAHAKGDAVDEFFPAEVRRNPFPMYELLRAAGPVHYLEKFDVWLVVSYDGVKQALDDPESFCSRATAPGPTSKPLDWLVFNDPPRHTKLRALVSRAFVPGVVAQLEPRIREISRSLLDESIGRGEMDLVADYSARLPLMVIAEMLGIPPEEWETFKRWSDAILGLASTVGGGEEGVRAVEVYRAETQYMDAYISAFVEKDRRSPRGNILSHLVHAELDGERLTQAELLAFFQLLLLAGSETTINLINNAVLCLLEHPEALVRVRERPALLPGAIEEVLRFRSPVQAAFRQSTRDVALGGQTIPARMLVLPMIGAGNRDPRQFADAERFAIDREPNPHIAFGQGIHFCLGAALSRMEARIAVGDLLERMESIELASDEPWEPRPAFHVHGPVRLPIRFAAREEAARA
jgi:cytochrome P450